MVWVCCDCVMLSWVCVFVLVLFCVLDWLWVTGGLGGVVLFGVTGMLVVNYCGLF